MVTGNGHLTAWAPFDALPSVHAVWMPGAIRPRWVQTTARNVVDASTPCTPVDGRVLATPCPGADASQTQLFAVGRTYD